MNADAQLQRGRRIAVSGNATSRQATAITPVMSTKLTQRPKWDIDRTLEELVGADVRVAAKAFSPIPWTGGVPPCCLPVRDLFLPDNSQPECLQVYFEGRLRQFQRQIGIVWVQLDAPVSPEMATDGPICFRGNLIVILRGPAVVELAFPFQVERLPADPDNYWRDLRLPRAQFEFLFAGRSENGGVPYCQRIS